MNEIEFKAIELSDKPTISSYTLRGQSQICDLAFSNLYGWGFLYQTSWAVIRDTLVIRFQSPKRTHPVYLMPIGGGCNLSVCMQELRQISEQEGYPLVLMGVTPVCREALESECPYPIHFISDQGAQDYIYMREKLCTLSGKSLQSKRNHVNKFEKTYPDYIYEPISMSNTDECLSLAETWRHGHPEEQSFDDELQMIRRVLSNFDTLGLSGGLLRVEGKVIAFTIGSPINASTFGIHIEKALTEYDGAFAMINKSFALTIPEQYTYINREEDLGIEGLRKAKLSYKPELVLPKDTAIVKL